VTDQVIARQQEGVASDSAAPLRAPLQLESPPKLLFTLGHWSGNGEASRVIWKLLVLALILGEQTDRTQIFPKIERG
jgi:hypothetical protein